MTCEKVFQLLLIVNYLSDSPGRVFVGMCVYFYRIAGYPTAVVVKQNGLQTISNASRFAGLATPGICCYIVFQAKQEKSSKRKELIACSGSVVIQCHVVNSM